MRCATSHKYDPMLSHVYFFSPAVFSTTSIARHGCTTVQVSSTLLSWYLSIQSIKRPAHTIFCSQEDEKLEIQFMWSRYQENNSGGSTKFERCFSLALQPPPIYLLLNSTLLQQKYSTITTSGQLESADTLGRGHGLGHGHKPF